MKGFDEITNHHHLLQRDYIDVVETFKNLFKKNNFFIFNSIEQPLNIFLKPRFFAWFIVVHTLATCSRSKRPNYHGPKSVLRFFS